jgi:hypothetical protein
MFLLDELHEVVHNPVSEVVTCMEEVKRLASSPRN